MFETSKPASLPWYVMGSPTMPADVTPDQVRQCVASYPDVRAVELSAAFLSRRPGSDISEWRLDQELEGPGINVYFVPGGCATWEVHFCAGPPGPVSGGEGPGPSRTADNGIEDEIAAVTSPSSETGDKGEVVLQPKQTAADALKGIPLKDRMRQLAAEGHSTRMIPDLLSAEGRRVFHMTVARAVRRREESDQPRLL